MEIHVEKSENNVSGERRREGFSGSPANETAPVCVGDCQECRCSFPEDRWRISKTSVLALSTVLAVFLGVLTLDKAVAMWKTRNLPAAGSAERSMTLSATGKSVATPDAADIQLSVLTEGATPEAVGRENSEKMNAVTDYVKSLGIESSDIATANYSLYPKYEYIRGRSNIVGYTLTQMLRVVVRDSKKIGLLLEGAISRGANQVGEVRFFVDDPEKFRAEARKDALGKVRQKAEELAALAGVKIGLLASFSESSDAPPPPVFYAASREGIGGDGVIPRIEPGAQDVMVTVTARYLIE